MCEAQRGVGAKQDGRATRKSEEEDSQKKVVGYAAPCHDQAVEKRTSLAIFWLLYN